MQQIITTILFSWIAGFIAFIGAGLATLERFPESPLKNEIIRGIVAFGGGILIAAVAFAMVPHGLKTLSAPTLGFLFAAGGLAFCLLGKKLLS